MSGADWVKLIVGSFFTAALTIGGQLVVQRYQHAKTKERTQWEARLGRVTELKTVAGYLYSQLSGWSIKQHRDELYQRLGELEHFAGEFAERAYIVEAIWALQNTAGWILTNDGHFDTLEERDAIQAELKQHYDAVIAASQHFLEDNRAS